MTSTRRSHLTESAPRSPAEPESVGGKRLGAIRIGCAGWSIPARHASLFGNGESHLARYAARFNMTEINSTFYRLHRPQTFERWAACVPAQFRFSVKLSKQITHDARLEGTGDALTAFFDSVAGLGAKLGGVLIQLPPSLVFDARVANRFFAMLRRRCALPIACEPRHPSWFDSTVDALWQRHAIARAAADPARVPAAALPAGAAASARWSYWRWHGSPRMYYSQYDDVALRALAQSLLAHATKRSPAWCVLDNTAHGHAVEDAARLQKLIDGRTVPSVNQRTG